MISIGVRLPTSVTDHVHRGEALLERSAQRLEQLGTFSPFAPDVDAQVIEVFSIVS